MNKEKKCMIELNNNINTNKFKNKERNLGIDLMRIIAMYSIVIDHIIIHGRLLIKYKKYSTIKLLLILCFWHINSFALISGIVGYKRYKYSNLLYLWVCVVFYSSIIYFFFKILFSNNLVNIVNLKYKTINLFFPAIMRSYWYFTEYFCLYLFIPIINKGILYLNKLEIKIIIKNLLILFIIIKNFINPNSLNFNSGYSFIWLLILYIVGAYFGL